MRRLCSLFLTGLAIFSLTLAGLLAGAPEILEAHQPRGIALALAVPYAGEALLAREAAGKHHRQNTRERRGRAMKQRAHQEGGKHDRANHRRSHAKRGSCAKLEAMRVSGEDLCTHGPDPVPPGLDPRREVPLVAVASVQSGPAVVCDGDGQSGFRVQALYVHASDVANRYPQLQPSLINWISSADQIFQANAAQTGGTRNLRFVHNAACAPVIAPVEVAPTGDDTFGASVRAVIDQGFNHTDRIYLLLVDTTAAGICGIATMSDDDRVSDDNWNNDGPSYARIDAGCWSGSVIAHELTHNLGGVQDSAPHATGAGHCIDEYDIMCYRDGPSAPAIQMNCPNSAYNASVLDCNYDDYFNTHPAPGSYLATHWNPANNRFLIVGPDVDPPPPAPPATVNPPPDTDAGHHAQAKHQRKHKGKGKNRGGRARHKR